MAFGSFSVPSLGSSERPTITSQPVLTFWHLWQLAPGTTCLRCHSQHSTLLSSRMQPPSLCNCLWLHSEQPLPHKRILSSARLPCPAARRNLQNNPRKLHPHHQAQNSYHNCCCAVRAHKRLQAENRRDTISCAYCSSLNRMLSRPHPGGSKCPESGNRMGRRPDC